MTLFAIPKVAWKLSGLTNSNDHVDGSPSAVVHSITAGPPLVQFVGVVMVNALARGARTRSALHVGTVRGQLRNTRLRGATYLSLENIVASVVGVDELDEQLRDVRESGGGGRGMKGRDSW